MPYHVAVMTAVIFTIVIAAFLIITGAAIYSFVAIVANGLASLVGGLRARSPLPRVPHADTGHALSPSASQPGKRADTESSVEDMWHRMQGTSNDSRRQRRRPKTR